MNVRRPLAGVALTIGALAASPASDEAQPAGAPRPLTVAGSHAHGERMT
jgi:hypothetical protein